MSYEDDTWLPGAMMNINLYETKTTPVQMWTRQDCYNWALSVAQQKDLRVEPGSVEMFRWYTGNDLIRFTQGDFEANISRRDGVIYYECLQGILETQRVDASTDIMVDGLPFIEEPCLDFYLRDMDQLSPLQDSTTIESDPMGLSDNNAETYINLEPVTSSSWEDTNVADLELPLPTNVIPPPSSSPFSTSSSSSSHYSLTPHEASPSHFPGASPSYNLEGDGTYPFYMVPADEDWMVYTPAEATPTPTPTNTPTDTYTYTPPPPRQRRRGACQRAIKKEEEEEEGAIASGPLAPMQTTSRNRSRGPKNWEFVMRLLLSPQYNPSLIQWVDREEGTFKFNKPTEIARMWGQRSTNRDNLSYDNFARGLRYHYTTQALIPVSERQLVYKCGPKATAFLTRLSMNGRH